MFLKVRFQESGYKLCFLFRSFERKHAMGLMGQEFQTDLRVQATAARDLWQIYEFSDCRV